MLEQLILLIPPLIATYAMSGLKRVVGWIDRRPPLVQQLLAAGLGIGLGYIGTQVGVPQAPRDLAGWDQQQVTLLLQGLSTLGLHAIRKGQRR